jgi:hypothetical protein
MRNSNRKSAQRDHLPQVQVVAAGFALEKSLKIRRMIAHDKNASQECSRN